MWIQAPTRAPESKQESSQPLILIPQEVFSGRHVSLHSIPSNRVMGNAFVFVPSSQVCGTMAYEHPCQPVPHAVHGAVSSLSSISSFSKRKIRDLEQALLGTLAKKLQTQRCCAAWRIPVWIYGESRTTSRSHHPSRTIQGPAHDGPRCRERGTLEWKDSPGFRLVAVFFLIRRRPRWDPTFLSGNKMSKLVNF